ncbi:hypothetical protein HU200_013041 [Digitaria exilis]|uniref:Uncharacterized protein n=1 Tax=Digitaria exilis TaxID=1010633 RepID=A0A835ASM7_9POAL|nr:hypothetical protein HU200_055610 [Digitaria exilis]KAF8748155.1 hypothetical protein HU200_013041 [Digitaria exilis]CAB3503474.1 unnamed protein product [Digitaria exilis]
MASQQAEKAAELQDPRVRVELDRRVREEGEAVVKGGGGGTTLDAQERLAEGRKKGGLSRTTEPGNERVEKEGAVRIEPDEEQLQQAKESIGRG